MYIDIYPNIKTDILIDSSISEAIIRTNGIGSYYGNIIVAS